MRAIFRTVSAAALGLSSLSLAATASADSLSLLYSTSYYNTPVYGVFYRHGGDYYAPHYRQPRHIHHHHHDHGKHYGHDRPHAYTPFGHRHDRDHRDRHHGSQHEQRGFTGGHDRHGRDYGGGGHAKRTHSAYAGRE